MTLFVGHSLNEQAASRPGRKTPSRVQRHQGGVPGPDLDTGLITTHNNSTAMTWLLGLSSWARPAPPRHWRWQGRARAGSLQLPRRVQPVPAESCRIIGKWPTIRFGGGQVIRVAFSKPLDLPDLAPRPRALHSAYPRHDGTLHILISLGSGDVHSHPHTASWTDIPIPDRSGPRCRRSFLRAANYNKLKLN